MLHFYVKLCYAYMFIFQIFVSNNKKKFKLKGNKKANKIIYLWYMIRKKKETNQKEIKINK